MATPPRETSKERLAAAQAKAAAAADDAAAREDQERTKASRTKLDKLLTLDAATRFEALADGASDLVPADRRRLVRSLKGQAPPRIAGSSDRQRLVDLLMGRHARGASWTSRLMDLWHQPWIFGQDGTSVGAKNVASRGTVKAPQTPAGTGPAMAASPTRRPHDQSPDHMRQVAAVAPPTHRVDVDEPPAAIEGSSDRLSDPDPGSATGRRIIRRGASPETILRLRSAAEADRLKALPTADLAVAVTTGAMADLTDDDRQQVLDILIAAGHAPLADAFAPGARPLRKPLAMTGKGLPCEPGAPPQDPLIQVWIGCALAVITWIAVVWLGYAGIVSSMFGSP